MTKPTELPEEVMNIIQIQRDMQFMKLLYQESTANHRPWFITESITEAANAMHTHINGKLAKLVNEFPGILDDAKKYRELYHSAPATAEPVYTTKERTENNET